MSDKEKVLKGLEVCTSKPPTCTGCPYFDECKIDAQKLKEDALSMLKEQEPVEPEVEVLNEIDRLYRCQKCHKHFFYEKQKYCDQCGQAVKWE